LPNVPRSPQFQEHIAEILKNGSLGRKGLDAAKRSFAAARSLAPDDPRTYYAYGMALRAASRLTEAEEQFELAANAGGKPQPLGWHARVLAQVQRQDSENALKELALLSQTLHDSANRDDLPDWKPETARFIGRTLGYLEQGCDQSQTNSQAAEAFQKIRETLPQELAELCAAERQMAITRATAYRHKKTKLLGDDREQQFESRAEEKAQEVAQLPQWNEAKSEQEAKIQSLDQEHEKELKLIDDKLDALKAGVANAQGIIKNLQNELVPLNNRAGVLQGQITTAQMAKLFKEAAEFQKELVSVQREIAKRDGVVRIQQQGITNALKDTRLGFNARKQAVAKHEKAKGKLQPVLDDLNDKILSAQAELPEFQHAPSPETQNEIRQLTHWSSFLDWDFETERARVLESLE
jgi:hypothetical protein